MNAIPLVPSPEPIPAPWPVFEILGVLLFMLHILCINVVLGGSLLALLSKGPKENSVAEAILKKIPSALALGVTLGIAPLLFLQVLYGHLIYTSSILMALWWILIIPLLIIAYYGTYLHAHTPVRWLGRVSIGLAALIFLYIVFIYTNNMTLMLQPEKWSGYFTQRGGTLLNWSDASLWPRYLHFVVASVAVAGLFTGLVWQIRLKKGVPGAAEEVRKGLRLFAIATTLQVAVGLWFLVTLPREIMRAFMGGHLLYTILLGLGIILAIGALVLAFKGKFWPAFAHLIALTLVMVLNRMAVRDLYIGRFFRVSDLPLKPQYDVMILFVLILFAGLGAVWYMVRVAMAAGERREGL
ncbi:MAG TPA: hypothetical protein PLG50_11425 [bacterium]|nr:hypothetical protein [bacterium]HQG46258.1 hypothetical protein [bacterium]HQI48527.1 hypothetical protein [bacterium]HQJ64056.1 hypothetical protein [bacterium]